jgi:predicted RecA/RadA family phage recombinase
MSNSFVQPGDTVTLTAPYQRNSGEGALVGKLFGVAAQTVANGVAGEFMTKGVHTLTKNSAEAWTVGAAIYWDDTNKRCTTTSTSNTLIGCALAVAANPSSTGKVRLNGTVS